MSKRKVPSLNLASVKSLNASNDSAKSRRVTVRQLARGKLPRLPLRALVDRILSVRYHLSVALVGDARSKMFNRRFRQIDRPTNILSFALSPNEGELLLNLNRGLKEAKRFHVPRRDYICYLMVHGMLHLKGLEHGQAMERLEEKNLQALVTKKFLVWLTNKENSA